MMFVLLGRYDPEQMETVHNREDEVFSNPPKGVTVISRYATVGRKGGFVNIVDAENAEQLASLVIRFVGLVEFEVHPIMDTAGGKATQLISEARGEMLPMYGPMPPETAIPVEAAIETIMEERRKFDPPEALSRDAYIKSLDEYKAIHKKSMEDMEGFWAEKAEQLDWFKKWDKVLDYDFTKGRIRWFEGGKLNVTVNCLDRHLKTWRKNKAALVWEGEDGSTRIFSYQQLHFEVGRFANVLKKLGVGKGDTVTLYLPMVPELVFAMLACARVGAVHSVVFGGFSAESLRDRVLDCGSKVVVVADGSIRGGKIIGLKNNADEALKECACVEKVLVVRRANINVEMEDGRDFWLNDLYADVGAVCEPEVMDAEDPLFILYTSGSTGKPKGVMHTTAGYLLYVAQTTKWIFDAKDEDTFWCTADIGWVTGHSYITYGPLALGLTSIMYEGIPTFPKPDRFWEIAEKHRVNIFYTAPTVLRALARFGRKWVDMHDLSSLRILGTVGEPINPEAWMWYYKVVGEERCPVIDTWWQTETGGVLISPLPGAIPTKPGSASMPFPGVEAEIVRKDGTKAEANEGGFLVIKRPWPGIMRGVWGDPERFRETYFSQHPGTYFSGDGARVDEEGFFWLMGRVDDVINVSGHRIGTAEVESALVSHPDVAESAVVGYPHEIKGQGIYAFVTANEGVTPGEDLTKALTAHVAKEIGPIAKPDRIQFADALPKTRSGKIMRRILRKVAAGKTDELGDTTTLADPDVVDQLVKAYKKVNP
ncbi:MAG: acetate--CoA ligase [Planctomycetota bacterium]|jgi:acetyl-CoA synthetase